MMPQRQTSQILYIRLIKTEIKLLAIHQYLDLELVDRLELLPAVEAFDNDADVDISIQ